MKLVTSLAFLLFLTLGQPARADESAVPTLAQILLTMQHFPSAEQKATLEGIASDEQVDTDLRIIAGAIGNIEHQVPDNERSALQGIIGDPSASDAAKTLAGAALRFKHQLAPEDKAPLQALGG